MVDFKVEVYAAMPKNERRDHEYLIADRDAKSKQKKKKKKTRPEQKYLAGEIDLQQYADERYPERAERRRARLAVYPLPEVNYTCAMCGRPDCAIIKCMECENRVCKECVNSVFGSSSSGAAFVLLHHTYCLKFGRPIVRNVAVPGSKPPATSTGGGARRS